MQMLHAAARILVFVGGMCERCVGPGFVCAGARPGFLPTAVIRPFHEPPPPRIPGFARNSTIPSSGQASQNMRDVFGVSRSCQKSRERRGIDGGKEGGSKKVGGSAQAYHRTSQMPFS